MCLDAWHDEPAISDKDITVYKVVHAYPNAQYYRSPFRGEVYMVGDIKNAVLGIHIASNFGEECTVIEAGIHTLARKKEAFNMASKHNHGAVMKCVIPAGTKHFRGEFGPYESYASEQLVVGRRIGYNWLSDLYYRFTGK